MREETLLNLIEDNYDRIIDEMMALHQADPRYQVDLYIYPDGRIERFTNVGGNSFLDDDHGVICSINHEHDWEECRNEAGDFEVDSTDLYDMCKENLDAIIDSLNIYRD